MDRGTPFYWFWRCVARFVLSTTLGTVRGEHHIPRSGAVLVLANHCGTLDAPFIGSCTQRKLHFISKAELFEIPGLREWIRALNAYPVRRGAADLSAVRHTLRLLQQGEGVLLFPEGTRSPDGRLQPAEPGAIFFALRSGAPVIPAAIAGSEIFWPRGCRLPRWHPISVRFGPPLRFPPCAGLLSREMVEWTGRCVMEAIGRLLEQERAELARRFGRYPLYGRMGG